MQHRNLASLLQHLPQKAGSPTALHAATRLGLQVQKELHSQKNHDHAVGPAPHYQHIAWCYDAVASAYSLGAIDRAKAWHHELIKPGDKVLYAGAGRGREIAEALQRGAEVVCVEPCPAMAARLHRRLSKVADDFTIVPHPIQSISTAPIYDLVIAHFFLNVFNKQMMPNVLDQLAGLVRPGGRLVIADFAPSPPTASSIHRIIRTAYYRPANLAGYLLRICALHTIYDYASLLTECGFTLQHYEPFRSYSPLPAFYKVISASRPTALSPIRATNH